MGLVGCSGKKEELDKKQAETTQAEKQTILKTPQGHQYGGHLRIGYNIEPTSLDAVLGRSGGDAYYWHQIFDQLVDVDKNLKPRVATSLATSWEISENPDAITFKLREGVVFHDGEPFNAAAVKYNIERILDPATIATPRASMTVIESVDVLDESTVRFNLTGPWGAGLNMLADRGGVMSSPSRIEALAKDYGWNPAGTGPFIVDKVIMGTSVHMVRNENYWGKDEFGNRLPYLDEITIRVIRDETVRSSALRTGEIDIVYLPLKDVTAFLRDQRFQIETYEGGNIGMTLVFNVGKSPLDDINLRLAIAYALDSSVINRAVFFERAIIADSGMWPIGAWSHDPNVNRPTYDPEKARAYMAESSRPEGFEFTAVISNQPATVLSAEVIRAMLKKIGITMNIEVLNVATATEKFFHGQAYPLYITGWSRYPEPDWLASLAYRSDGYYNASKISRPDVDELVLRGASLYSQSERKAVYDELNELILREAWFVPLLYGVNYAAAPQKVRNLDRLMGWDAKMNVKEIWIERE
ncbi:MAG: ABC transporter substrate-binding protein [bacterium]